MPRLARIALALLVVALAAPVALAQTAALDAHAVYTQAAPAVAVIRATIAGRAGVGSAFVIDARGTLLTAAHVVRGAQRIAVDLGRANAYDARLVGYDARRDLAVLRITVRQSLPALEVADGARVGEPVVVIGAPRGRPRVMTTGEITGVHASLPSLAPGILVRVSAAVAPGSSGGPILNAQGRVVGVVIAAASRERQVAALGVSAETIAAALPDLLRGARVERPWMGIAGRTITPEVARQEGLPVQRGVLVEQVVPGSPAAAAGLRDRDVIVSLDGEPIADMETLVRAVTSREVGERVTLGVVRGQREISMQVTLGPRP